MKKPNVEHLIQISNEIQDLCIDIKHNINYEHHLPYINNKGRPDWYDTFDLPNKEEVIQKLKELDIYYRYLSKKIYYTWYGKFILHGNWTKLDVEVLPPWIVYPHVPRCSGFWTQGAGDGYYMLWSDYLRTLSEEDEAKYEEKWPLPEYMNFPEIEPKFAYNHY